MNINKNFQNIKLKSIRKTSQFPDYRHLNFGIDSSLNKCLCLNKLTNFNKLIFCVSLPNSKLIEFFQIWPLNQWISSLIGLVALYVFTTYIYNKRLVSYNNEMSVSFRFWMIVSDLAINLALGIYYLDYRETIMGQLMLKCPIAVSPVIFLVELLLVILIKEYEIYNKNTKLNKKKKI